jgi:ferritin-like metal-binding protein YciE
MAEKDLNDLFLDTLKDIYYAEKQIYKSLPKMAGTVRLVTRCVRRAS